MVYSSVEISKMVSSLFEAIDFSWFSLSAHRMWLMDSMRLKEMSSVHNAVVVETKKSPYFVTID